MKKIVLFLFLLNSFSMAQVYSRWNYTTEMPYNQKADTALVNTFFRLIDNHGKSDTVYIFEKYEYKLMSDSSFELPDLGSNIIRVFDPRPVPDGVTELTRENTVVMIKKASPAKKSVMVGGDGILPKGQTIESVNQDIIKQAKFEAKVRKALVQVEMLKDKNLKRKDAWKKVNDKIKADKLAKGKASKVPFKKIL